MELQSLCQTMLWAILTQLSLLRVYVIHGIRGRQKYLVRYNGCFRWMVQFWSCCSPIPVVLPHFLEVANDSGSRPLLEAPGCCCLEYIYWLHQEWRSHILADYMFGCKKSQVQSGICKDFCLEMLSKTSAWRATGSRTELDGSVVSITYEALVFNHSALVSSQVEFSQPSSQS